MVKENFRNVKVNGVNYKLKLTTQNNPELGKDARGITYYEELKIFLDRKCANDLRVKTFYHELAHCLCETTSFNNQLMDKLSDENYEIFIDQLGEAIQMFIHNNDIKDLEDFIQEK